MKKIESNEEAVKMLQLAARGLTEYVKEKDYDPMTAPMTKVYLDMIASVQTYLVPGINLNELDKSLQHDK